MSKLMPIKYAFAGLRMSAILAVVGWSLFYPNPDVQRSLIPVTLYFVLYSLLLYVLLYLCPRNTNQLYLGAMVLDLVFITLLVVYTGGLRSHFFLAYILLSAVHSFHFGLTIGLGIAFVSFSLYLYTNLPSPTPYYWGDLWLRGGILLATAATIGYLSDAVKNTRKALERKIDELSALTEVSRTVNSSLELPQVLSSVVELSAAIMKMKACTVHILDEEHQCLRSVANFGFPALEGKNLSLDTSLNGRAVRARRPIAHCCREGMPGFCYEGLLLESGLCCALCVTLSSRGKTLGTLTVFSGEPHDFTDDEVELIGVLAAQVGNAIENASLYQKQKDLHLAIVQAFVAAIDAKDSLTRGHSEYVHRYTKRIAQRMGLSEQEIERIATAAILHDVGKIGISSSILRKPGALTNEEYGEIKIHVTIGSQIISKVPDFCELAPIIYSHHEWYNGRGYPEGLAGEEIPFGARIIAVADAFEAMTANRVYRRAMPKEMAVAELIKGSGTQFDPKIVNVFLEIIQEGLLDDLPDQHQSQKRESVGA